MVLSQHIRAMAMGTNDMVTDTAMATDTERKNTEEKFRGLK